MCAIQQLTYEAWGKQLSITGTMATTIGTQNPFRYRSYYYDSESGFYYLNSRYYDPDVGRFLNADTTDVLRQEQGSLIQYNLYTYCLNNPVNMDDKEGEAGVMVAGGAAYALLKALAASLAAIGSANFWNPVGWSALGITTVAVFTFTGISVYKAAKGMSEHKKKGTTSPSKKKKHEKGQIRKQTDQIGGEKGDQRRTPRKDPKNR